MLVAAEAFAVEIAGRVFCARYITATEEYGLRAGPSKRIGEGRGFTSCRLPALVARRDERLPSATAAEDIAAPLIVARDRTCLRWSSSLSGTSKMSTNPRAIGEVEGLAMEAIRR